MRRTVTRKLLQGQDICFICALRYRAPRNGNSLRPQRRLYRAATPSKRPAGAAVARVEEEDDVDTGLSKELLGWKCRCNHVNKPARSECTLCSATRPQNVQMVYRDLNPSPPLQSPSAPAPSHQQFALARNASPPSRTAGTPDPGSISAILSQRRFDPRERAGSRARSDGRNNIVQSQTYEEPFHSFRPDFQSRNQSPARRNGRDELSVGKANGYGRESPVGYPFGSFATSSKVNDDNNRGPQESMRLTQRSRVGNALRLPRNESTAYGQRQGRGAPQLSFGMPFERQQDPSPQQSQSSMDSVVPDTKSGPQQWAPMVRAHPRQRQQEFASDRRTADRGTSDIRIRRLDGDISYRERRNVAWGGQARYKKASSEETSASPQINEEAVSFDEGPIVDETEEDSRKRKMMASKENDRRARLYEIEEEEVEPIQVAPARNQSFARRRGVTRGGSEQFHIDPDLAQDYFGEEKRRRNGKKSRLQQQAARPEIVLPEFISVEKLAQGLKVRLPQFLEKLEEEGFEGARYDHILDSSTSAMFAEIYGFDHVIRAVDDSGDIFPRPLLEDPSELPTRPPVVTIMGHVDHGKTTILDYFRKANVVATEHGGITQHIGAFSVTMPGSERNITFLDTPGHAAFLEMRRRGAVVTDIVVLVVAADDSVKAQTIEAIKHAREAGVQMIVAINKVDKPGADVEQVKRDLMQHDIAVEDLGGEYQAIPVSGKTGRGMDDLEEAILALSDVADFRAETDGPAEGWIIESRVGITGRVATVLVRRGTLRPGDFIVAGTTWARVRTLRNDAGDLIEEAPPGTPVQIDGWRGDDPEAGLEVLQAETEQRAKDAIAVRQEKAAAAREIDNTAAINASRAEDAEARTKVLQWEKEQGYTSMAFKRRPKDNEGWIEKEASGAQLIHFVIKADVAGSTEALVAAVAAIGNNEARANIVHSGTGGLTESDIKMLAATGEVAYAISFNQPIDGVIRQLAVAARINILDHNIIYKVTDDVTDKVGAELPPLVTQRVLGEAEVGDIFEIKMKKGLLKIAGCRVTNGNIRRAEKIRVLRRGETVYTGTLNSFKNIKKDVTEMRKGSECGMGFENWDAFEVGDQIQSFEEKRERRALH